MNLHQESQNMIEIVLPIEPQSKQRPRAGKGKVYTATKTRIFESRIKQLTSHLEPIDGPLVLEAIFVFKRPKRMSKKITDRQPRLGVPDVDNLLKALCDGLQGNVVTNDSSFVQVTGSKVYAAIGEDPCIEVVIKHYDRNSSPLRPRAHGCSKSRILAALSEGKANTAAIQEGLISESTFYRWKRDDPKFQEAVNQACLLGEIKLLEQLQSTAQEKSDWRAFAWLLERKFPNEYGPRYKVQVTTPVEATIDPRIQEQLEKLDQVYAAAAAETSS